RAVFRLSEELGDHGRRQREITHPDRAHAEFAQARAHHVQRTAELHRLTRTHHAGQRTERVPTTEVRELYTGPHDELVADHGRFHVLRGRRKLAGELQVEIARQLAPAEIGEHRSGAR